MTQRVALTTTSEGVVQPVPIGVGDEPVTPPPPPEIIMPPSVTTLAASGLSVGGATLNGDIIPHNDNARYHFEWGTTESYGQTTPEFTLVASETETIVQATLTNLQASTTYNFRLVAVNRGGTVTGGNRSFTTPTPTRAPLATTRPASGISATAARLNGRVTPLDAVTTWWFEYGPDEDYGSTTSPQTLAAGSSAIDVGWDLTSLAAASVTHFRVVARNAAGTTTGADASFTTNASVGAFPGRSTYAVAPTNPTLAQLEFAQRWLDLYFDMGLVTAAGGYQFCAGRRNDLFPAGERVSVPGTYRYDNYNKVTTGTNASTDGSNPGSTHLGRYTIPSDGSPFTVKPSDDGGGAAYPSEVAVDMAGAQFFKNLTMIDNPAVPALPHGGGNIACIGASPSNRMRVHLVNCEVQNINPYFTGQPYDLWYDRAAETTGPAFGGGAYHFKDCVVWARNLICNTPGGDYFRTPVGAPAVPYGPGFRFTNCSGSLRNCAVVYYCRDGSKIGGGATDLWMANVAWRTHPGFRAFILTEGNPHADTWQGADWVNTDQQGQWLGGTRLKAWITDPNYPGPAGSSVWQFFAYMGMHTTCYFQTAAGTGGGTDVVWVEGLSHGYNKGFFVGGLRLGVANAWASPFFDQYGFRSFDPIDLVGINDNFLWSENGAVAGHPERVEGGPVQTSTP